MTPRLALIAMVAASVATPASANSKRFGVGSYERLHVRGDMIVDVTASHLIGAVAEGSREALDTLSLEVVDRTLTISQRSEGRFGPRRADAGPIRIRLTAQNLAAIDLRGSGRVTATGLRGPAIVISLDGAGQVSAAIPAGATVTTRATGSGTIALSGRTRTLVATATGSSTIDAEQLAAVDLTVRANGTGASRFAASGTARIIASGEAAIDVAGRPRCTVTNTGAGTVHCGADQRSALPTTSN